MHPCSYFLSWLSIPCIERGRDWQECFVLGIRGWCPDLAGQKRHSFLISGVVCGGSCALSSSCSRSEGPAPHTLAEDHLLNHSQNLLLLPGYQLRCSHLCAHLSPPLDYKGLKRRDSLVHLWIPTVGAGITITRKLRRKWKDWAIKSLQNLILKYFQ